MQGIRRLLFAVLILALLPGAALAEDCQLALNGFYESAFQGEYGDTQRGVTIRWEGPIILHAKGDYTAEDIATLAAMLYDLTDHVPDLPALFLTTREEKANVTISFVPQGQMKEAVADYQAGNIGFVWVNYDSFVIKSAQIAISTDTGQLKRSAIIREEVVNMLGLLNDITGTTKSIICQSGKTVSNLSNIDYAMLNYLYSPLIPPGTTQDEARRILGE